LILAIFFIFFFYVWLTLPIRSNARFFSMFDFIREAREARATHIACGSAHSICVTLSGEVLVWGRGKSGRLGLGPSTHDRYAYYTCWWYSLCNFQYREHYENTCSYNVDCWRYTNLYFCICIVCGNTRTSMIKTNVFFDLTAFQLHDPTTPVPTTASANQAPANAPVWRGGGASRAKR
jgi:hypothetical protein